MFVGRAYFEEMARTYSAARLVFNRSLKNDVNMRVFEAVACGSLLLTNDLAENGQAELFRDGIHLATYHDGEDLLDKAAYYLRHDALRERIAAAGRAEAIEKHTYDRRMRTLLEQASRGALRARTRSAELSPQWRGNSRRATTSSRGRNCLRWFPVPPVAFSSWVAAPAVWVRHSRAGNPADVVGIEFVPRRGKPGPRAT